MRKTMILLVTLVAIGAAGAAVIAMLRARDDDEERGLRDICDVFPWWPGCHKAS
jgi:hypothetical protein